jgi:hypothetical protein
MNNSEQGNSSSSGIQPEIAASSKASAKYSKSKNKNKDDSTIGKKLSASAKAGKQSSGGSTNIVAANHHRARLDDYQAGIRVWPD